MSNDRHPDLDDLYDQLLSNDDIIEEDDLDDADYDLYVDALDMDEEMGEEDDDDEYDEEYEDGEEPMWIVEGDDETVNDDDEDEDEDEDEEEEGTAGEGGAAGGDDDGIPDVTFRELARLFNNAPNAEARSSLLARLLAGPADGDGSGGVAATRSGPAGLLRRLGAGLTSGSAEERRRLAIAREKREKWWSPQTSPHPQGAELLRSGEFGTVGYWRSKGRRSMNRRAWSDRRYRSYAPPIAQATIPNSHGTVVAAYPSIPYVGQYAGEDYGVFYTATQDITLHLYSTLQTSKTARPSWHTHGQSKHPGAAGSSARAGQAQRLTVPVDRDEEEDEEDEDDVPSYRFGARSRQSMEDTSMQKIKAVQGREGRWTVTDCDADKKGDKMIYSSITPYVHMIYTAEDESDHICLDFSNTARRGGSRGDMYGYDSFGIWSIRFSADGKEVVAGAGGGLIMVYDIEAERRTLSVQGHADDVNAVCFADESSTNILVSGSDDGYVKIWDRRSLSSSTPSGILVGATEGITYTSPKGDGRYIVVNSKDQAARLYDLRKMRSHSEFEHEPDAVARYGQPRYDYRNSRYPPPQRLAHPKDCSVMTYRGHSVLRTLIRCHFSPRESTGQGYIYSGSSDGQIHIWSLDGRVVQVLDRAQSNSLHAPDGGYNDPSSPDPEPSTTGRSSRRARRTMSAYDAYEYGSGHCVRDVSWHGYEPTLMSTCWEMDGGYRRGGTLAKHEWKGLGKGGMRNLEDWVEKAKAEAAETAEA